ncbi:MAG: M28 family peptidase [Oscillospiraceae bacterium]|jgi:hypothetical protein|nr:M28 family peptidase [Oscillospiraceae bacterium]
MKTKRIAALLLVPLLIAGLFACGEKAPSGTPVDLSEAVAAFTEKLDLVWAYDLAVEVSEGEAYRDNVLGDRQAGSDAEHATAEKIEAVMKEIGLADVTKDPVTVDRIQANGSTLVIEGDDEANAIQLHAYQTQGIDTVAEIVDVGTGTMWDYYDESGEEIDVAGKIVLLDIDQREDWWIGTPAIQAKVKGAAAVLAVNVSGFAEIAEDAYNANDFCGPADIPTASITQTDAKYLRSKLEDNDSLSVHLKIDNAYEKGSGTSYNVRGRIKGLDASECVVIGAHYDAYFSGFQDDTIAWTGVLALAKAMIESGYTPLRDIVFICHGAEEWGEANTAFDWAAGSYREITGPGKSLQGAAVGFVNFELPAVKFADYTYTLSAPESYGFVNMYTQSGLAPDATALYPDGVQLDGYLTSTYADDFSYYINGVPSFINGMMTDIMAEEEDVFEFYYTTYHTNYDTKDTYDEAVFAYNLKYYGGLAMYIAETPAVVLDFTYTAQRLADSTPSAIVGEADLNAYADGLEALAAAGQTVLDEIVSLNEAYAAADATEKLSLYEQAKSLNAKTLNLFKEANDAFVGLSEETPIVPHEWYFNNILTMEEVVALLTAGDVDAAVDDYAWAINGVGEWYAMSFDEETVEQDEGTYLGKFAGQNWGTGRIYEYADVEAATRSLTERYGEEPGGDFSEEIAVYAAAIDRQTELFHAAFAQEITDIQVLTADLVATVA